MPLGGRLEKNQSDEKAAQGGSRGVERALRKRATPVVPLSQIAPNERLNNGTANTLSTRNKNYERDDRGNDKLRNEFLPKNILFPAATYRGFAMKLSMKSLHFDNILNPEVN